MESNRAVQVEIWSHARYPPLSTPAHLAFDLRTATNPPKAMRDKYDGRAKRLREHLLHDSAFVALIDTAAREIAAAMTAILLEETRVPNTPAGPDLLVQEYATGSETNSVEGSSNNDSDQNPSESSTSSSESQAQQSATGLPPSSVSQGPILRVSCSCVRGRHRSVAFAEEVAKRLPKSAFVVQVIHRDVDAKSRELSKTPRKRGKEKAVRSASMYDY